MGSSLGQIFTDLGYLDGLSQGDGYGNVHRQRIRRLVNLQRAHRNRPDRYWIAEATPKPPTTHATPAGTYPTYERH